MTDSHTAEPAPLLTIPQAARRLGVSEMTLYRAVRDGTLPFYRIGRAIRLDGDQLEAMYARPAARELDGAMSVTRPQRRRRGTA